MCKILVFDRALEWDVEDEVSKYNAQGYTVKAMAFSETSGSLWICLEKR